MKLFVTNKKYEKLEKEFKELENRYYSQKKINIEAEEYIKELERKNKVKSEAILLNHELYSRVNIENKNLKDKLNELGITLDIEESNLNIVREQLQHEKAISKNLYNKTVYDEKKIVTLEGENKALRDQLKKCSLDLIKKYTSKYKKKRIRNKKIKEAELKALKDLMEQL